MARRTSGQSTGTVVFDTVMLNQGSHYDNSTGIFTAPIAGLYNFSFNVLSDNNGSDSYFATSLYKNGSGYAKVQNRTEDDNDFGSSMSVIASLAVNDTVQVVQHNVNLYGTSSADENLTWFSGYLIDNTMSKAAELAKLIGDGTFGTDRISLLKTKRSVFDGMPKTFTLD